MESVTIKTEDPHQICRLCLSEESLNDVFEEEGLHHLISNYLSITIYTKDRMSKSLCAICKLRLTEFHQFRINCHEAQIVQQSMIKDRDIAVEEVNLESQIHEERQDDPNDDLLEIKRSPLHLESCSEELPNAAIPEFRGENNTINDCGEEENEQSLSLENTDIENDQDEGNTDDDLELPARSSPDLELVDQEKADVTTDKSFECSTCHKVFSCRKTLWHHKITDHDTVKYNCSLCGIGFIFKYHLAHHLKSKKHAEKANPTPVPDDPSKPYKCEICNKGFKMLGKLKGHQKFVHESQFHVCPICDLKFGDKSGLQRHLRNHYQTGEPLSLLKQALESAPKKVELKVDGNVNVRPFKCNLCPKAFKENRRLTAHKKRVHVPKIFRCKNCDFKCDSRYDLRQHKRKHYRERAKVYRMLKKNVDKQEDTIPQSCEAIEKD